MAQFARTLLAVLLPEERSYFCENTRWIQQALLPLSRGKIKNAHGAEEKSIAGFGPAKSGGTSGTVS